MPQRRDVLTEGQAIVTALEVPGAKIAPVALRARRLAQQVNDEANYVWLRAETEGLSDVGQQLRTWGSPQAVEEGIKKFVGLRSVVDVLAIGIDDMIRAAGAGKWPERTQVMSRSVAMLEADDTPSRGERQEERIEAMARVSGSEDAVLRIKLMEHERKTVLDRVKTAIHDWASALIREGQGGEPEERGDRVASRDRRRVWVVHGRNEAARLAMVDFLRAVGLDPVEWSQAVASTGVGTPTIDAVLDKAFEDAQAVVVLLTGDDEARLRQAYLIDSDLQHERALTPQARANVLFEAGLAFGRDAKRTILVQLGEVRPFSDIAGRHILRMDDSPQRRQELVSRLQAADCAVDVVGRIDWLSAGKFGAAVFGDTGWPTGGARPGGVNRVARYSYGGVLWPLTVNFWGIVQHTSADDFGDGRAAPTLLNGAIGDPICANPSCHRDVWRYVTANKCEDCGARFNLGLGGAEAISSDAKNKVKEEVYREARAAHLRGDLRREEF